MTSELFTTHSEEYANSEWLALEEIEYVLQQPVEDAFQNGLPLYCPINGWQEVSQAEVPIGKLFIAGHCRIHRITTKFFEIESTHPPGSYIERRLYLSCGLYADGYAKFRLPFDALENLWNVTKIEDLNNQQPPAEFNQEVRTFQYNCPERPPLNYLLNKQMACQKIASSLKYIRDYCELHFISGYDQRIEMLQRAAEQTDDEKADHYYINPRLHELSASAKENKDTDRISTQGRNSLIRTARALAKCLVPELDDIPTPDQLKMLVKLMEDEHNDIPCDVKTLKKHLTNPD